MGRQIEFRDDSFPAARRDLFLAFLMGLYAMKFAGWESMLVLGFNLLGALCLLVGWVMALNASKLSAKLFLKIWWAGLALILVGQILPFFQNPAEAAAGG